MRGHLASFGLLVAALLLGCGGGGGESGVNPGPYDRLPDVRTDLPIALSGATWGIDGAVNPKGLPTVFWLQYGADPDLRGASATARQSAGSDNAWTPVSSSTGPLQGATVYYYRLWARNSAGSTCTAIDSFTTGMTGAAPTVLTLPATGVTDCTAVLVASVIPNGLGTTAWFEWGESVNLLAFDTTPARSVGDGTASVLVTASLSGIPRGTGLWYFRVVASNGTGTTRGGIVPLYLSPP